MIQIIQNAIDLVSKNYKVAFVSAGITLSVLWGIVSAYGVSPKEITMFLIDRKGAVIEVADQLDRINRKIDAAELESHKNQLRMLEIVQEKGNHDDFNKILNYSSENQDIIRAQLEFGRMYATLVETNTGSQLVHKHLSNLYEALLEVTLDDPFNKELKVNSNDIRLKAKSNRKSLCRYVSESHICKAKRLLEEVHMNISDFPDSIKQRVEIEAYRYLSYTSARVGNSNKQQIYTNMAENLLESKYEGIRTEDPKKYRRQFYWIDYSQMMAIIMMKDKEYEAESKEYFDRLKTGLVSDEGFLRLKLIQHEKLIPANKKEYWKWLISQTSS